MHSSRSTLVDLLLSVVGFLSPLNHVSTELVFVYITGKFDGLIFSAVGFQFLLDHESTENVDSNKM